MPIMHVNSRAAALWLAMVTAAPKGSIGWAQEVVEAYSAWTAQMNGLGLPVDTEIDRAPAEWSQHYYALFAERLMDARPIASRLSLISSHACRTNRSAMSRRR